MLDLICMPAWLGEKLEYSARPRPKRSFHTVLDAADFIAEGGSASVELAERDGLAVLDVQITLKQGRIDDRVEHARDGGRLRVQRLERRVSGASGYVSRLETVDFASSTHVLPACTYVEVSAPFLLGAQPFDGKLRSMYAWICDRFVAKVYYESRGVSSITVPAGRIDVREVLMYPDLNDWVNLPSIITRLSKPFLPKYHMFYEVAPPHRLVRFEGPYGPPGAPEVVLELQP